MDVDVYVPTDILGRGVVNTVREFVSATTNKRVAVKSANKQWFDHELFRSEMKFATQEIEFVRHTMDNASSRLTNLYVKKRNNIVGQKEFTLRSVLPYAGPITVHKILKSRLKPYDAIGLVLSMTYALMLLHAKGIIHGDVKEDNIVSASASDISRLSFVDFGFAYYLSDAVATCNSGGNYWAPERRCDEGGPAPHTSQDVYSFANMLNRILINLYSDFRPYFSVAFPSIVRFIDEGLNPRPEYRPQLSVFYKALSKEFSGAKHSARVMATAATEQMNFTEVEQAAIDAIMF